MNLKEQKEGWHHLAVNHKRDFYCLSFLHCFRTKSKLEYHKKLYKNKGFYEIVMSSEEDNILELNK